MRKAIRDIEAPRRLATKVEAQAGGTRRAPKCHLCMRQSAAGKYLSFVDGRRRWVCAACIHEDEMATAQERDEANESADD
jgi:hypothetical protein